MTPEETGASIAEAFDLLNNPPKLARTITKAIEDAVCDATKEKTMKQHAEYMLNRMDGLSDSQATEVAARESYMLAALETLEAVALEQRGKFTLEIDDAVTHEREACARLLEQLDKHSAAAAIRSRK